MDGSDGSNDKSSPLLRTSPVLGTALMLDMHVLSEARGTGTAVHTTVLMRNASAESKPLAQGHTAGGGPS